MNINVEPANDTDVPVLTDILNDALWAKLEHSDEAWGTERYTVDDAMRRIQGGSTYIAYLGNEAIGTAILLWDDPGMWGEQPADAGYVHGLGVKKEYLGKGVGRMMLDWATREIKNRDRKYLRLDCPAGNDGLCSYYESLGFTKVAERPNPMFKGKTTAYFQRVVQL